MNQSALNTEAWNQLFLEARTFPGWTDKPVDDALLVRLYELLRMGPTAMNCQPLRLVFVKSTEAKARLKPCLSEGNVDKTMAAPVTAIVAYDPEFHEELPALFPHWDGARASVASMSDDARGHMATINTMLQAGYLITAARGLGLDCGPMGGFDQEAVDREFFADGSAKSLILVNLGYGDRDALYPRGPRLDFERACTVV